MKTRFVLMLIVFLLFFCVSYVQADEDRLRHSLSVKGSYTETDNFTDRTGWTGSDYTVDLGVGYEYYLTHAISLGGDVGYSSSENWTTTGESGRDIFSLLGTAKLHLFTDKSIVPYLGILGGFNYTERWSPGQHDIESEGFSYGAMAGADFIISRQTSFFLEYNVKFDKNETWTSTTETTEDWTDRYGASIGFRYFF